MYIIYKSSQKTRHQKLNSYWVMNSLGDKICPPAAPSTPVNKIEQTYMHACNTTQERHAADTQHRHSIQTRGRPVLLSIDVERHTGIHNYPSKYLGSDPIRKSFPGLSTHTSKCSTLL